MNPTPNAPNFSLLAAPYSLAASCVVPHGPFQVFSVYDGELERKLTNYVIELLNK
jgi:hypothetical protein